MHRMDLDRAKAELTPRDKVVFFCSPHNPGGRVWEREEIVAVAQFCEDNDLILVSDEIHNDLVFPGAKHIPTAIAAPFVADRLITCVAATKTFNLAGAHVGATIAANAELRRKIDARIGACGLTGVEIFGLIATETAWREGDEWLDALDPVSRRQPPALRHRHRQGHPRRPRPCRCRRPTLPGWISRAPACRARIS